MNTDHLRNPCQLCGLDEARPGELICSDGCAARQQQQRDRYAALERDMPPGPLSLRSLPPAWDTAGRRRRRYGVAGGTAAAELLELPTAARALRYVAREYDPARRDWYAVCMGATPRQTLRRYEEEIRGLSARG